jgi:hypothetical protein
MPRESKTALQKLQDQRTRILDELRRLQPDLVNELLQLNIALAVLEYKAEIENDEYLGYRSPLDAMLLYLDKVARAVPRERMAKEIAAGGYGRGTIQRPYWTLLATINYHLEGKKKRIVERNGLIGKPDWPEELFKPEEP